MNPTAKMPWFKRTLCAVMSVVMAVSLMPLPAYADDTGTVVAAQPTGLMAASAPASGDTIWIADADDDESTPVTELHTSHRYKIASSNDYVNQESYIKFSDVGGYESEQVVMADSTDREHADETGYLLLNGLYLLYSNGNTSIPSGYYTIEFPGAHKPTTQVYHVIDDGSFIDAYAYGENDLRAFAFDESATDADYDGRYDSEGELISATETALPAIDQSSPDLRLNARLSSASDISASSVVQLEGIALYKADGTFAENTEGEEPLTQYQGTYPDAMTFTDETALTPVWISGDADTLNAHFETEGVYYQNLIIDKLSIANVPLESGIYFPMLNVSIDGKPHTFAYYPVTVTATDPVVRANPRIATASVPDGTADLAYSATLKGRTGATTEGEFAWALESGNLPDGLDLDSETGVITGTPTETGDFTFTVKLTETVDGTAKSATREYSMHVYDDITLGDITYESETKWLDYASNSFALSVPVSTDLMAAGYSKSTAEVLITQNSLPNAEEPGTYNILTKMAIGTDALFANAAINGSMADVTSIEVRLYLRDDNGDAVLDGEGNARVLKVVDTNPRITVGGWATFSKLDFSKAYGDNPWNDPGWPVTEARVRAWPDGESPSDGHQVVAEFGSSKGAELQLAPGDYLFAVEGKVTASDDETAAWIDIMGGSEAADVVNGTHPVQYRFTVGPNVTTDIDLTFTDANLSSFSAAVQFEDENGGWVSDLGAYELEWYRGPAIDSDDLTLVGTGTNVSIDQAGQNVWAKAVPIGEAAAIWDESEPVLASVSTSEDGVRAPVVVQVPRKKTFKVSGTLSTATSWTPAEAGASWGVIQIQRPLAGGGYASENVWATDSAFELEGITNGTVLTYTPATESVCGPVTRTVENAAGTDIENFDLVAPNAKGIVTFDSLKLVRADDQRTPADDSTDDRTVDIALTSGAASVQVYAGGTYGTDAEQTIPFYIFNDKQLVILDEQTNLTAGTTYDVVVQLDDPSAPASIGHGSHAATEKREVTLAGDNAAGSAGDVTLTSLGNAAVSWSNQNQQSANLLLYDASGNLVEESTLNTLGASKGTLYTPFLAAGDYTLYACTWDLLLDAYEAKGRQDNLSSYYDTLAELQALVNASGGNASENATSTTFTIVDNQTITAELAYPIGTDQGLIDRANSSVSATSNYSEYMSISIRAQLAAGASAAHNENAYIELYTNQAQGESAEGTTSVKTLSMNGKAVNLNRWSDVFAGTGGMTDGCLRIDLDEAAESNDACDDFPLRASLVIPRIDVTKTEVWAWLVVDGQRSLIGSFSESHEEVTLTAPERVASSWDQFWVYGETGPAADVAIYLDGMRVATTTADEFGFYTVPVAPPSTASDLDTFTVTASATWQGENASTQLSATSAPQEVTYTTSQAAIERITMFYQSKPNAGYTSITVYDRGKLSAKYFSYYRAEVDANTADGNHAMYYWAVELANPKAGRNVKVHVPRSDGDEVLETTHKLGVAYKWIPGLEPKYSVKIAAASVQSATSTAGSSYSGTGYIGLRNALKNGTAWVTKPTYFTYAPNEVFATFEDCYTDYAGIEDGGAFTGFSGAVGDGVTESDVKSALKSYLAALNEGSYVNIASEDDTTEGHCDVMEANDDLAVDYYNAENGVDEWLALGTGSDSADSPWLKVHHTTAITDASSSEATQRAATALALCESGSDLLADNTSLSYSILDSSNTVIALDRGAEVELVTPGVTHIDLSSDEEDEGLYYPDPSCVYFIETQDANGNAAIEMMYKFEIGETGQYAYSLVQADKQTYVNTSWNEATGQKKVLTYRIVGAQVSSEVTKLGSLCYQWNTVFNVLQLGYDDAVSKLETSTGDPTLSNSVGKRPAALLKTQSLPGVTQRLTDAKADAWAGLAPTFTKNNKMTPDEARALMDFLDDNKTGGLDVESTIQGSAESGRIMGGIFNHAKWAFATPMTKKVAERAQAVTDAARKGPSEVLKVGGRLWFDEVTCKFRRAPAYSQEYYGYMHDLWELAKEANKNKSGYVNMDRFPADLKAWFEYLDAKNERMKGKGYNGKFDPSGYVYEAVESNRVEGATVVLYTYNSLKGNAYQLDSEKFGVEPNPQTTGADGRYQWFVPEGYWQVRVTKSGYEPFSTGASDAYGIGATRDLDGDGTEEASEYWMPVLPEQVDVNIPLVSKEAPHIDPGDPARTDRTGVEVTFHKYMKADTVTADLFEAGGVPVKAIEAMDAEPAADGSLGADGQPQMLARTFRLTFADSVSVPDDGGELMVRMTAAGEAQSYAGVAVDPNTVGHELTFDIPAKAANTLTAKAKTAKFTLGFKKSAQYLEAAKLYTVSKAIGKVTYAKNSISGKSTSTKNAGKFTVNATTGRITVAASTPADTYTVKVNVKAAGDTYHKAATKTLTYTVVIGKGTQTITASNKECVTGKTVKLGATVTSGAALSYKSSNTKVATVSSKGVVTGKKAGSTKITITAKASANWNAGTKTVTVKVGKANPLVCKAKKATVAVAYSKVKAKAQVTALNVTTTTKAQGKLSYANASTNATAKKFTVAASTGKVTVPKATKKGKYPVVVKVTAKGNSSYISGSKTVKYTIQVK